MVPPHIGGQSNPLHRFISQVSQEGRQQIDLCSGQHARQLAMTCLKAAQDNLAAWLEQAANQHELGDHFCLRSEVRRVGKGCVSTCRTRRSSYHEKKTHTPYQTTNERHSVCTA